MSEALEVPYTIVKTRHISSRETNILAAKSWQVTLKKKKQKKTTCGSQKLPNCDQTNVSAITLIFFHLKLQVPFFLKSFFLQSWT